ncbi:hypothetical protein Lalb_Chr18g0053581 [Lupinus albus]|uniref:Uncharacterized protein n=1 Tax=Lupinus albus TaxID=3870 RepID=A0A6A4P6T5_LUPAL|nr:hypothetical protein Lalb_Chr18g0053581 [Lupinus albus]
MWSRLAWHLSDCFQKGSKQIHDCVISIDVHSQKVAQTIENVEDHIGLVLRHSESVYEKTTKNSVSQSQLQEGQENMKRILQDGVAFLKDFMNYEMLNHQMLLNLINKISGMENQKELLFEFNSDYVDYSEWFDKDLPDDVNCLDDPDLYFQKKLERIQS